MQATRAAGSGREPCGDDQRAVEDPGIRLADGINETDELGGQSAVPEQPEIFAAYNGTDGYVPP